MRLLTVFTWIAGISFGTGTAMAQELKVGDKAPEFMSTDDAGKAFKSSDVVGKKIVVVYFYPADFTGGCTNQACAFRDDYAKLKEKGVEVIGVSGDSVKGHAAFKTYYKLPFKLLADEEGTVAKAFGVPAGKGGVVPKPKDQKGAVIENLTDADGKPVEIKQGVRIQRWTFVIDKDGKIAFINKKVNAAQDAKSVAEVVEKLK